MRSMSVTVSASAGGNAHSSVIIPDAHLKPFNIGFGIVVATTAHFTVQHTFDNLLVTPSEDATWFPHEFVVQSSANIDGNYSFPIHGIRIEISAANQGGVTGTFIQAGYTEG